MVKYWNEVICGIAGAVGGAIAALLGGWTHDLATLVTFMGVDFAMGLIVALFNKSHKTKDGGISSSIAFVGLVKKVFILLIVLVAYRLDLVLGVDYVRTAVIIAFMVNEAISILENASLLGIPLPKILISALEVLKEKCGEKEELTEGSEKE
ncbi:MAG: phage holin family protein [Candidatus Merdivicinus sp.]|jgi:toxin secretion/phage lysis holin